MADDPKPKASFLGGAKPPAAKPPEIPPAEQPASVADTAAPKPSFLRSHGPAGNATAPAPGEKPPPPAVIESRTAAAPPVIAPPPPPPAPHPAGTVSGGNRALAEQHLQRGLDHYDRQDLEEALFEYQKCVKADPGFSLGYNNLGMVLIDLERYDEALSALYESVRCDPNYAEAYNNLGFVLRRMQRNVEGAAAYNRFLELDPDVEESGKIKGWVDSVLKDKGLLVLPPLSLPPGRDDAPPARLSQTPPVAAPVVQEIKKIKKMGAWEAAAGNMTTAAPISALGEVSSAPPTAPAPAPIPASGSGNIISLIERGMDHLANESLTDAMTAFQQACELDATNAEAHIGVAKVLIRQERFDDGIEVLQKAVALDASDPAAYYVLGFALRAIERNVEASEAYEIFLKLLPNSRDAGKMRQWVLSIKGTGSQQLDDEEINAGTEGEQIVSESDKKYKQALAKFQKENIDVSLRECVQILTEDSAHFRTRVLLGRIYTRQGNFDQAIEQLEGALVTHPDYPEALYFLGQAAEKKGLIPKTSASFQRYLEVVPTGPRAERIRGWLEVKGRANSTAASGPEVQCELCLRVFPQTDISMHEGKSTCCNCLSVMGASSSLTPPPDRTNISAPEPVAENVEPAWRRPKGVILLASFGCFAIITIILFSLGVLNPVIKMLGLGKNVPSNLIAPPINNNFNTVLSIDKSKIKISNEPRTLVLPFAKWSYSPILEGLDGAVQQSPDFKLELKLKTSPAGMVIDEMNRLQWSSETLDYTGLKSGLDFPVELVIKASAKDPNGVPIELFSISKSFVLRSQFGYDMDPEFDLGLNSMSHFSFGTGDFNADGRCDILACSGSFRNGSIRLYVQRPDNTFAAPIQLATGSRFSAVCVSDLDGNGSDDFIACNWQSGQLVPFYQQAGQPVAGPTMVVGSGPVAIAVSAFNADKNIVIGVLLSVGRALAITTLSPKHQFGEVVHIPLPTSGSCGYVFPWVSKEAGPGFLAITPYAEFPLQFIATNGGQLAKTGDSPIQSGIDDLGLIVGAAPLASGSDTQKRLAVLVGGKNSKLLLLEERAGKFILLGKPLSLPATGMGLATHDLNDDGEDDLLVSMPDETGIYFSSGSTCDFKNPLLVKNPQMLGPISLLKHASNDSPDLLLLDDNRKGHLLRAVIPAVIPEAQATSVDALNVPQPHPASVENSTVPHK